MENIFQNLSKKTRIIQKSCKIVGINHEKNLQHDIIILLYICFFRPKSTCTTLILPFEPSLCAHFPNKTIVTRLLFVTRHSENWQMVFESKNRSNSFIFFFSFESRNFFADVPNRFVHKENLISNAFPGAKKDFISHPVEFCINRRVAPEKKVNFDVFVETTAFE